MSELRIKFKDKLNSSQMISESIQKIIGDAEAISREKTITAEAVLEVISRQIPIEIIPIPRDTILTDGWKMPEDRPLHYGELRVQGRGTYAKTFYIIANICDRQGQVTTINAPALAATLAKTMCQDSGLLNNYHFLFVPEDVGVVALLSTGAIEKDRDTCGFVIDKILMNKDICYFNSCDGQSLTDKAFQWAICSVVDPANTCSLFYNFCWESNNSSQQHLNYLFPCGNLSSKSRNDIGCNAEMLFQILVNAVKYLEYTLNEVVWTKGLLKHKIVSEEHETLVNYLAYRMMTVEKAAVSDLLDWSLEKHLMPSRARQCEEAIDVLSDKGYIEVKSFVAPPK